jgi:hypothetical protein
LIPGSIPKKKRLETEELMEAISKKGDVTMEPEKGPEKEE